MKEKRDMVMERPHCQMEILMRDSIRMENDMEWELIDLKMAPNM